MQSMTVDTHPLTNIGIQLLFLYVLTNIVIQLLFLCINNIYIRVQHLKIHKEVYLTRTIRLYGNKTAYVKCSYDFVL